MEQCIQHSDGTMITSSEWSAIKATGRLIKAELLALKPTSSRDRRVMSKRKTKSYFCSFYPNEWHAALLKMEQQQPLLALCASHWKADHVLRNSLLVKTTTDNDLSDTDSNSGNSGNPPNSKRRGRSSDVHQQGPDKRRKPNSGDPEKSMANRGKIDYVPLKFPSNLLSIARQNLQCPNLAPSSYLRSQQVKRINQASAREPSLAGSASSSTFVDVDSLTVAASATSLSSASTVADTVAAEASAAGDEAYQAAETAAAAEVLATAETLATVEIGRAHV